jgi:hypothetical protein
MRHRAVRKDGKRSKFEAAIAADLTARGVSYEYEKRRLSYELPCVYIPDFELPNGIIIEAKGWLKPSDRRKMVEVKRANPHLDIRFVFQKASNRIGPGTKSASYSRWAEHNGFPWAEGRVPEAWVREPKKGCENG